MKDYKIAVAGTGYVGLSIATLLAQHHQVTAVDVIPEKVELINKRKSPIQDEYIEKYLAEKPLRLTATLDGKKAYSDADFVVMQQPNTRGRGALEMKSLARWAQKVTSQYPYYSFSRHDGVEILSKYPFNAQPIGELQQSYRYFPYIVSWYQYYAFDIAMPNHEPLRIIGCYMTSFQLSQGERQVLELNGNRQWRTTQLYEKMHEAFVAREHAAQLVRDTIDASCPNVIVCMDLNDVPQSYAYRTIMGHDMRDSYRKSSLPQATFNDHNMLFHIDHILYRGAMDAVDYKVIHDNSSDHYPVVATFEWTSAPTTGSCRRR